MVPTFPRYRLGRNLSGCALTIFRRSKTQCKDGKQYRYLSVVESRRMPSERAVQKQVLFLGEVNERQEAAWRKTLEGFDEREHGATMLSLFPEDRKIPADALDGVKLGKIELRRARANGNY
jgi:hypothetical protein